MPRITIDSENLCTCKCGRPRVVRPRTPVQVRICRFIQEYAAREGCPPKFEEIKAGVGISKVQVCKHVHDMATQRVLTFTPHRARSIVLADGLDLGERSGDEN